MQRFLKLCLISVVTFSLFAEDRFHIDAIASIKSIQKVIAIVRSFDKEPVIGIRQGRLSKPEMPDFDKSDLDYYDVDTLIVTTGFQKGPLYGGGCTHYFRRVRGWWTLAKTESWVS